MSSGCHIPPRAPRVYPRGTLAAALSAISADPTGSAVAYGAWERLASGGGWRRWSYWLPLLCSHVSKSPACPVLPPGPALFLVTWAIRPSALRVGFTWRRRGALFLRPTVGLFHFASSGKAFISYRSTRTRTASHRRREDCRRDVVTRSARERRRDQGFGGSGRALVGDRTEHLLGVAYEVQDAVA